MFKHNLFWYFQTMITVNVSNLVCNFFLNKKVYGLENINKLNGGGVLFAANHGGSFDPFLIGPSLPRPYLNKIKAYRFLTYYKYVQLKWYGPLIWLSGAYSVHPRGGKLLDLTLARTVRFLKNNQSILIFPIGTRKKPINIEEARPGAGYLAKTLNPVIVPVLVTDTYRITWLDFLLRKRNVKVIYGEPFYHGELTGDKDDIKKIAAGIMRRIKDLEKMVK